MDGKSAVDVIVVGGGNAALCAALAARETGASVKLFERAPEDQRGGNSGFAGGNWRTVYQGVEDIRKLVPDLTPEEIANTDFGSYSEEQFFDDMARVTQYRTNPDLCEVIVRHSLDTLVWMRGKGVRFLPYYGRQSFKLDGRVKFWGGLTITVSGGGIGVVDALFATAVREGVQVAYGSRVTRLLHDEEGIHGVEVIRGRKTETHHARAVVLACGGFEANAEWRTRYLGKGWDLAKVRGTRFNTGDGIQMAIEVGAQPYGHWSGCHAVGWERYATDYGEVALRTSFQRHSYPYGLMINAEGKRFVDEGADLRPYTYAKYGHVVLEQPGQFAWQIYDAKVEMLLREEYRGRNCTKVTADTLEGLVAKMEGVDQAQLLKTLNEYNAAASGTVPFNPTIKDGLGTTGLAIPKSNWARKLDTPPFQAFAITCGVTFTFGGIKINPEAEVLDQMNAAIPGLFAAGEIVGGIFYFNYPGGSGLTSGAVFGKVAGTNAAKHAKVRPAAS
ncbi:MAG: FAD-dependent tricarballylate dehydrogenase TcuA [Betaproteobacteria bacterium]|nr:FAD-dependent tricarballylate dehydrogenase TcuA [Betaproteobacteria bacterium]